MRAPYGLEIIESCLSCPHREDRLFCNLPPPAVQKLAAITRMKLSRARVCIGIMTDAGR